MKISQKFTFRLNGLKGNVVYADFQSEGITVEITATSIFEATQAIRKYLADSSWVCDQVTLVKIEL